MWAGFAKFVVDPARRWAHVFAKFTLIQATAQLIGIVAGIVVVRLLPKHDYALYTIANSVLWALVILSDGGISAAAAGVGGRAWEDAARLGRVIKTALSIRWKIGAVLVVPITGTLALLLLRNGANPREATLVILVVLFGAIVSLGSNIYIVVPRLLGNVKLLQIVVLTAAVARLAGTIALGAFGLNAETAMLAIAGGFVVEYWQLQRWAKRRIGIDSDTAIDEPTRVEFLKVVRRQIPNALYYIFQTQISIWLLSVFSTSEHIADLGALTRISVVYAALSAAVDGLMIPRFARCNDPGRIVSLYLQIFIGLLALAIVPVLAVWAAPHPFLWILGPKYYGLSSELTLAMLSALTGVLNGLSWSLNATRAWFLPAWIYVGLGLVLQAALLLVFGASTIQQVLIIAILMNLGQTAMNVGGTVVFVRKFRQAAAAEAAAAGEGGI